MKVAAFTSDALCPNAGSGLVHRFQYSRTSPNYAAKLRSNRKKGGATTPRTLTSDHDAGQQAILP